MKLKQIFLNVYNDARIVKFDICAICNIYTVNIIIYV